LLWKIFTVVIRERYEKHIWCKFRGKIL